MPDKDGGGREGLLPMREGLSDTSLHERVAWSPSHPWAMPVVIIESV
jgi:hypothetical protein